MKTQLITFLFCFTSINAFQCPNGWDQPAGENVCMFPITQPQYYSDVVHQCDLLTATPVKIRNIYENAYVMQFAQANVIYPYIGVERKSDSTWAYADGSPLTYPNWDKGEPSSNLSTHCAILRPDTGKWLADDCSHTRPSICSFDGGNATSPPTTPYLTSPSPSQCSPNWVYSQETNYCYFLQNFTYPDGVHWQLYNWTQAEANCQAIGSHLVSVHSHEEAQFIYNLIASHVARQENAVPNGDPCFYAYAWTGLYGTGDVGNGNWSDGTPVDYPAGWIEDEAIYWQMINDASCQSHGWGTDYSYDYTGRYVCKTPVKKN